MTKTLDLGCGSKPRNPFGADELFGVDVRSDLEANVKEADLVIGPIPYEDESFEYLTAFDFIEHIPRVIYAPTRRNPFVEFMNEVYRTLKPGGLFLSSTPAYPHIEAFQDPTHLNFITTSTFPSYFDGTLRYAAMYGFYGAFRTVTQRWHGPHLFAMLQKIPAPEAPPTTATAGWDAHGNPHIQLSLYQFLKNNDFPTELAHQEALRTIQIIVNLRNILADHAGFSAHEREEAESCIAKCLPGLQGDPMFAQVLPLVS